MNWGVIVIIVGLVVISFQLAIVVLMLASLRKSFDLLAQVVAVGIQRSGLVRTQDEVKSDMEQAQEDLDNEISEAELEAEEALKEHEE